MKRIFILFISITFIYAETGIESLIYTQFQKFITKYHKKYSSIEEYLSRFAVFRLNFIDTLKSGQKSYLIGITKFSDLTPQEFKKKYLNLEIPVTSFLNQRQPKIKLPKSVPDSWDWRDHIPISYVWDQSSCNAGYLFSTICNLESIYAINKGNYKTLSLQYFIDCDTYDSGCSGGLMESTFKWLVQFGGGLMTDADYPYTGYKGTCKADSSKYIDMSVTGFINLGGVSSSFSPADEGEMKEYVYEVGALAVGVNGTPLQTYSGGIIDLSNDKCNPMGINHACAIIGYGTENGLDYWIVKNSYGSSWGENGFFRIARGKGTCGINMYVLSGIVKFNQ